VLLRYVRLLHFPAVKVAPVGGGAGGGGGGGRGGGRVQVKLYKCFETLRFRA